MMSTTGAGLAITGSSGQDNAAQAQYGEKDDDSIAPKAEDPGEGTKGVAESPQTGAAEQAAVVDDGGSLPFTGFFTIPLIIGGVALLTSGAVLRRRTRE